MPPALSRAWVDMGVEPLPRGLFTRGGARQRLVRLLCPHCKAVDDSPLALSYKTRDRDSRGDHPLTPPPWAAANAAQTGYPWPSRPSSKDATRRGKSAEMVLRNASTDATATPPPSGDDHAGGPKAAARAGRSDDIEES